MPYQLSSRSQSRLAGVHPKLIEVVSAAIESSAVDFCVLEGLRTRQRQEQLFKAGATKTLNSRHLTGHAVDLGAIVDGGIRWDWPLYHRISKTMKDAAARLGIAIVWGGDWASFPDGPHFELDRRIFP